MSIKTVNVGSLFRSSYRTALISLLLAALFSVLNCSHADAQAVRSIKNWVVGDGKTDDALAAAQAFAAGLAIE